VSEKNIFFSRYILAIPCNVQLLLEVTVCTVHTQKSEGLDKKYVKENINIGQTFVAKHKIASFLSKKNIAWTKSFI
jgi:hypothetical protein